MRNLHNTIFVRKSMGWTGILFVIVALCSCSEDFTLLTPGDAAPVVYCLLNPDAGEQYVRLGRTFQSDTAHPEQPPITDSTVWNLPVDIYMEEWQNDLLSKRIQFNPCLAPVKDTGFFSQDNLRLYRADFIPVRLATYRLYVLFPDDNRLVYGSTTIPGYPVVNDPLDIPGRKINLQSEVNYTIRWIPPPGAGLYQGVFHITYQEDAGNDVTFHEALFGNDPVLDLTSGTEISWILTGTRFFQEIARQIPVKPDVSRKVINVQFRFYTGGEELALHVSPDIEQSRTTGPLNPYTNLINGTGIFSSIQIFSVNNLELSNTTLNELAHGDLTGNLGFLDIFGGEVNN
jgi:hypothetical protein